VTITCRPCILADDLTGALDAAARFTGVVGSVPTVWRIAAAPGADGALAIDAGTREGTAEQARRAIGALAATLVPGQPAFKKLDSLLRGHTAVEIAVLALVQAADPEAACVIAPAFPFQGRMTRGGRQWMRQNGGWRDCGVDLAAELAALGVPVRHCRPGDSVTPGVSLWDAGTDADLDAVVAAGYAFAGPVLWCGSAGLAGALGDRTVRPPPIGRPLLMLIGSRHPATLAQVGALGALAHHIDTVDTGVTRRIETALARDGTAAVLPLLPPDTPDAAPRIAALFEAVTMRLARPAALLVSGGETLRAVCESLGADRLDVDGEIAPGVPTSIMRGGGWNGLRVISKSGAFGQRDLLADIADAAG